MEAEIPPIKNGARAVIVRDGAVLMLKKESLDYGVRYVLPGGSQDPGETMEQALARECLEEIGADVEVHDLLHLADFFKPSAQPDGAVRQKVEFLFDCAVPDEYQPTMGSAPDKNQVDVVWVELATLETMPVFPKSLTSILQRAVTGQETPVYLRLIE